MQQTDDTGHSTVPGGLQDGSGRDDSSIAGGVTNPCREHAICTPWAEFSAGGTLTRWKCHGCGRYTFHIGQPVTDDDGIAYCGCGSGMGMVDGFGGVDGAPPSTEFRDAVLDRRFHLAQAMIDAGADVHEGDERLLRWACDRMDREAIGFLLANDADPGAKDSAALRWAMVSDEGCNSDIENTLIHHGASREHAAVKPTVISAGASASQDGHRYWGCPICGTYIDALMEGRIIDEDRLACPKCGSLDLNVEDGGHFDPDKDIRAPEVLDGKVPEGIDVMVKECRAILSEAGLFPADDKGDEPRWPKDLAACVLAAASMMFGKE